jgi:hypothetical protein
MKCLLIATALLVAPIAEAYPLLPAPEYDRPFDGTVVENIATNMDEMADLCSPHPDVQRATTCAFVTRCPSVLTKNANPDETTFDACCC